MNQGLVLPIRYSLWSPEAQGKSELQLLALLAGPLGTVGVGGSGWAAHSSYCVCIESALCSGAGHLAPNRQLAFSPHLSSSSGTEVRPESGLQKCLLSGVFTQTGMGLTLALKVVLAFSSGPWTLDR